MFLIVKSIASTLLTLIPFSLFFYEKNKIIIKMCAYSGVNILTIGLDYEKIASLTIFNKLFPIILKTNIVIIVFIRIHIHEIIKQY